MRALWVLPLLMLAVPDRQDLNKKDAKPLQEQIQGEWRMVKAVFGGNENRFLPDGTLLTVKGKTMAYKEGGQDQTQNVAFTLDEIKKPAALDVVPQDIGLGPNIDRIKIPCIVQIEGNVLTICFHQGIEEGKRPTEFGSPPNTDITILEFIRVQK